MIPRSFYIAVSILLAAVLGMGIYVWHMRGRAAASPVASTDTRPVTPPVAGATERVTLYVAYDDIGILRPQPAQIPLPSVRQQRVLDRVPTLQLRSLERVHRAGRVRRDGDDGGRARRGLPHPHRGVPRGDV